MILNCQASTLPTNLWTSLAIYVICRIVCSRRRIATSPFCPISYPYAFVFAHPAQLICSSKRSAVLEDVVVCTGRAQASDQESPPASPCALASPDASSRIEHVAGADVSVSSRASSSEDVHFLMNPAQAASTEPACTTAKRVRAFDDESNSCPLDMQSVRLSTPCTLCRV